MRDGIQFSKGFFFVFPNQHFDIDFYGFWRITIRLNWIVYLPLHKLADRYRYISKLIEMFIRRLKKRMVYFFLRFGGIVCAPVFVRFCSTYFCVTNFFCYIKHFSVFLCSAREFLFFLLIVELAICTHNLFLYTHTYVGAHLVWKYSIAGLVKNIPDNEWFFFAFILGFISFLTINW